MLLLRLLRAARLRGGATVSAAAARTRRLARHLSTSSSSSSSPTAPQSVEQSLQSHERRIADLQAATREALAAGRLAEALEAAQQAREHTLAFYGPRHAACAAAANNVALALKAQGGAANLAAALALLEEAAQLYESLEGYGRAHASTATAYANLGALQLALARSAAGLARVPHIEAGRGYFELALSTRRAALGERHAMVGVSLYQLASAARMQRRFAEAEALLHESVALLRACGASARASTATALNNLGFLLKETREFARADAAYVEALAVRRELLGAAHPDSIATQHNLAECRRAAGDEAGAIELQKGILRVMGVEEEAAAEPPPPQDARSVS
jgi:tetratricopeptide (TPR) repeat protein